MESKKPITNPYREVGMLHNDGLDFIVKHLKPDFVTTERVLKLTAEYMQTLTESSKKSDLAFYCEQVATANNALDQGSFAKILQEADVSEKAACFISEINNLSEDFGYPTTLKVIANIEANILEAGLSSEDQKLPLMYAAVAKASVEYFIAQLELGDRSAWSIFGGLNGRRWPWRKDAEGAVSGAISGAITGGGVIIGAIGGAIFASAKKWLFG